jgi:hypothetical protein
VLALFAAVIVGALVATPAFGMEPDRTPLSSASLGSSTVRAADAVIVPVPDHNLAVALWSALHETSGTPITNADMATLTSFTVPQGSQETSIGDLHGLEYATNLTSLTIQSNRITDLSPLSGLTSLTTLSIQYNHATDLTPLSGLTNLTSLSIQYESLHDLSPLSSLTNLTTLDLRYNVISDLSGLGSLPKLTTLYLDTNNITDVSALSTLSSLRTLGLSNNAIANASPLSGLTGLTSLDLHSNRLASLAPLSGLVNLTNLSVASEWPRVSNITALRPLTNLRTLDLSGNALVTAAGSASRVMLDAWAGAGVAVTYVTQAAAPLSTISGVSSWWTRFDVTFSIAPPDTDTADQLSLYYGVDAPATLSYSTPITVSAEGLTQVNYRSVDAPGYADATQTVTIRIDRSIPVTFDDVKPYYNSYATIHLTASDARSGISHTSYTLDGVTAWGALIQTPPETVGAHLHTLSYFSVDGAGNEEAAHVVTFTVGPLVVPPPAAQPDLTRPVTVATGLPSSWTSAPVTFSLVASDPDSPTGINTFYSIGGSAPVTYTVPVVVDAEGVTPVTYYSVDASGNVEAANVTQVAIDRTPPTTTVDYDFVDAAGRCADVYLKATDARSWVAATYYSIDRAAPVWGQIRRIEVAGAGTHTIEYWSVDLAGNTEAHRLFRVTVPLTAASVTTPYAPSRASRGHLFTVYGYVSPRHDSGTYLVTLKFYLRNRAGAYVYHNSVQARRYAYSSTKSKYSAAVSLPHAGTWRVCAYHSDASHRPSTSGYRYVTVR